MVRRIAGGIGATLGTAVVFVVAAVGGAVLHSGTAPGRRFIVTEVNSALHGKFKGDVRLEQLARLGLGGVDGVSATVLDENGKVVAHVDGVRVRLGLPALVKSLLDSKGPMQIAITDLEVANADVTIAQTDDGSLTLTQAFAPSHPSPPDPNSRPTEIDLSNIKLTTASIHAELKGQKPMDAHLAHVAGSLYLLPSGTKMELSPFEIEAHGGALPAPLTAKIGAGMNLPKRADPAIHADIDAHLGDLPLTVHAKLEENRVIASVDVPQSSPESVKTIAPTAPVNDLVSAHVEVTGTLPHLFPKVHVGVGAGSLDGDGEITIANGVAGEVTLDAKNIDPRSFAATAPDAVVGAHVHVKFDPKNAVGEARIDGDGPPATVTFNVGMGNDELSFDAKAEAPSIATFRRVTRVAAKGQIAARARGKVELGAAKSIDARVEANAANVSQGSMQVGQAEVSALITGPLDGVRVDAGARVRNVVVGGQKMPDGEVTATGSVREPIVSAQIDLANNVRVVAKGELDAREGFGARDAEITATKGNAKVVAKATGVHLLGKKLDVDGLELSGLGAPIAGSAHMEPGVIKVRLKGDDIELGRASAILGQLGGFTKGKAAIDIDLEDRHGDTHGYVNARFSGIDVQQVKNASGDVKLTFADNTIDGGAVLDVPPLGRIQAKLGDVKLGGDIVNPRAWKDVTGALDVNGAFSLDRLDELLPDLHLPVSRTRGKIALDAHLRRASLREAPDFQLSVATHGLSLIGEAPTPPPPEPPESTPPPPVAWRIDGIDLQLLGTYEGAHERASVMVRAVDKQGPIVSATATTDVKVKDVEEHRLNQQALEALPFAVRLDIPDRDLSKLPPILRPKAFRGFLGLHADLTGTMKAPKLALLARGRCLQPMGAKATVPLDLDARMTYDDKLGSVSVRASRPKLGVVLDTEAVLKAKWSDVLEKKSLPADWGASAMVHFNGFPLAAVPQVAEMNISGLLNGTIDVGQVHEDGRVDANLTLDKLRVGKADYPRGKVAVTLDDKGLKAAFDISKQGSYLHATLATAAKWGKEAVPTIDMSQPAEAVLMAEKFRAAALLPFVNGAVDQLDGNLDANARLHIKPGWKDGTMDGAVHLSKAKVEIPALGQQLRDVNAEINIKPWGTVNIKDFSAEGQSGRLTAHALAKLNGFDLQSAEAQLDIPDDMPVTLQGVHLADAKGHVSLKATKTPDGKQMNIDVDIPKLDAKLPEKSSHSVQALDANPAIVMGTYRHDGRWVQVPLHEPEKPKSAPQEAMHMRVAIKLDDIEVRRDNEIRIGLVGNPVIDITDKATMSGQIKLTTGFVELQGKRFSIDHGIITFVGEPSNPQLSITAYWDAPDSTRIFADVNGSVKDPMVTLRSDPAHSQNDILSILISGHVGGDIGQPLDQQQSGSGQAAGIGASVLTSNLNEVLNGVTDLGIQTKIDTSNAQNPRPEIEVQVSRDIYVEVIYNAGLPPPGDNPDRTMVVLDYRFKRNWSVQTTVGDEGSSIVDLLWKYRY